MISNKSDINHQNHARVLSYLDIDTSPFFFAVSVMEEIFPLLCKYKERRLMHAYRVLLHFRLQNALSVIMS